MNNPPSTKRGAAQVRAKVLVVDDDPFILQILESMLARLGVDVITTRRAFGLLNLIATHRPILVLLDLKMPGIDGASLVALVREDPELATTTIVLHSSLPEDELVKTTRQCGADGYICKSGGAPKIQEGIARWLR
jgi:CheY-like chemotaxis protein